MWKLLVHYRHLFIISFSLSESVVLGFWLWSAPSWLCISASDITNIIVIVMVVTVDLVEQEWKRQLMDYRRASAHVDKQLSHNLRNGFDILFLWVAQSSLTLCDSMTTARQAPLSMGFPRQEYWSGLPFPSLGDLPHPGIESVLQADSSPSKSPRKWLWYNLQQVNCGTICSKLTWYL